MSSANAKFPALRVAAAAALAFLFGSLASDRSSFLFTESPRFAADAWLEGAERFPDGAQIFSCVNGTVSEFVTGFVATADPEVSFNGRKVLFAGKERPGDAWQIYEVPVTGGTPVRITPYPEPCIRPLYLPGERIAFARRYGKSFQVETIARNGTAPLQITYAPGGAMPVQVLADGRILFEAAHPSGHIEIYTVYTDGSGVQAVRCDHTGTHRAPRQLSSGDLIFAGWRGLGRFTPARTRVIEIPIAPGELSSPVAEVQPNRWLMSWRPQGSRTFSLYAWTTGVPERFLDRKKHALQPVLLTSRETPLRHPSGLHERPGANLLCLNAYESPMAFTEGTIAAVRVYSLDPAGRTVLLGETAVEDDGSFYVNLPSERPLRIELTRHDGKKLAGEAGWFWMRKGEQRICVGCHAGPERTPENVVPKVLTRRTSPVAMTGGLR